VTRRLVAAYACRAGGTRLYGKPLQNLEAGYTILDHLLAGTKVAPEIDQIVLGISEGTENLPFMDVAARHGIGFILGSQKDVLQRLIQCGRAGGATDVFRVTTECPFPGWEFLAEAWRRHQDEGNDITVTDMLPEGCNFEIYKIEALERAHSEGEDKERSEYCSAYPRRRHDLFKIAVVEPPANLNRMDLRLTVDYPEDLIVCREVFREFKKRGAQILLSEIATFLDVHPVLTALVQPYVYPHPTWMHTQQTSQP
jgi:spore coat polysaccharide biosynthesis protein SpsF